MPPPRLILVDGSAYIFRAFHALPPMNRKDGTPVNAVFGFTSMVMKLMEDERPDYAIVVLDYARESFRNEIYPQYKANRSDPPPELIPQFALIREATHALNLPVAELKGFEADDLIASYARLGVAQNMEVVIVSSDKDLMQLVGAGVSMLDPMKHKRIHRQEVIDRFAVPPEQVVAVQALAGDATDNVPGVPGIGIKTAAELINHYGSLEELLARADEIKQPKRRESLTNHADMARLSERLVRLADDAPVPVALDSAEYRPPDRAILREFLAEQGFRRLLARLDGNPEGFHKNSEGSDSQSQESQSQESQAQTPQYTLIDTADALKKWVAEATQTGVVAVDSETTSLTASQAMLVGVALATAPGRACYIPLRHGQDTTAPNSQNGFDFTSPQTKPPKQIAFDEAVAILAPLLKNPAVLKIGHNLKYDMHVMARAINGGFRISPVDDTLCLSYVLDAGRYHSHRLDDLAEIHLGHSMIKYEDICGKGAKKISFAQVAPADACAYAAEDADYTLRLWHLLKPRLAQTGKASVYERLERPLISVIAEMEAAGIKVDKPSLARMSSHFAENLGVLERQIHGLAGEAFNIASPKQLSEILFEKMGLEGGKKSKTGAWSTSVDVMEDLVAGGVEIAEKILEWRHIAKLKSTYADALAASIHPETARVHTSFSMSGASTGRLSSSDPNLQNIPIRTSEGRQIRTAFVAAPGSVLISADYSQIELRLVAHVAQEHSMIEAFLGGVDIHAQTAAEVFSIPLENMTPEVRRRAKAINFGIIYGISGFGLARQLGIPQGEARDYIKAYFDRFPGIRGYMEAIKTKAREDGFVETLFGRRIYISGITASNQAQRGFAERQAINAPIQGSAADIIKQAMVRMPGALREAGVGAKMAGGGAEMAGFGARAETAGGGAEMAGVGAKMAGGGALAKAGVGAKMLLQVHDELVFECEEKSAEAAVACIREVMQSAPKPTLDLCVPLTVDANIGANWDEVH